MPSRISLVLSKKRPLRSPARRRGGDGSGGGAASDGVTAASGGVTACVVECGSGSATLLLGGEQVLQLAHELPDVTEVTVHGREADVEIGRASCRERV